MVAYLACMIWFLCSIAIKAFNQIVEMRMQGNEEMCLMAPSTSVAVLRVTFRLSRCSRTERSCGSSAANGRTLATQSVHIVPDRPCSEDSMFSPRIDHR